MSRACYGAILAMLSGLSVAAGAQELPLAVHVTGVDGPVTRREIVRALPRARLRACQHTLMGGPIRMSARVSPAGEMVVDRASATGDGEIMTYVPCIRRVLGALRFPAQSAETQLRITLVFPAYGGPVEPLP